MVVKALPVSLDAFGSRSQIIAAKLLSIDKEWPGTEQTVIPGHLILSALVVLPENPIRIHEAGCGQRSRSGKTANACLSCKKSQKYV